MVRTIVFFFLAAIVLGTIAVPGLGAFALVLAPLIGLGLIWRFALTVETHGHVGEAVVRTKHRHFLGPGGPDDPFAAYGVDEDKDEYEYPPEASSRSQAA
jgi:hypothetical protein